MKEPVYTRKGNFAIFNQLGVKLEFSNEVSNQVYYRWLDGMIDRIGQLVEGAEIAEKSYARKEPRLNTGVYYDTKDHRLLREGLVLRTTCNIKTHAFCAYKQSENADRIRRDCRYSFDGEAKRTIQTTPTSKESQEFVKQLLAREDIEHPGIYLKKETGISGEDLTPALCIEQYRHPFFVWLNKKDALRCSMDRVQAYNLRVSENERQRIAFSEIELPLYPHLEEEVAKDPRVNQLIQTLSDALRARFDIDFIFDSKYQRAAKLLNIAF